MDFIYVASSNIDAVRWEDGDMYVKFHNGRMYKYVDVPEAEYESLLAAPSVGSHFATHIKPRFQAIQQ